MIFPIVFEPEGEGIFDRLIKGQNLVTKVKAEVHRMLILISSGLRWNDEKGPKRAFSESIIFKSIVGRYFL